MGGVVRAGIDATGLGVIGAKIARRGFLLYDRSRASRRFRIGQIHGERMHVDVSVGAIVGAQAASDAPVLNDDFQRIAPANRADRAADHAQRVAALAAGSRHEIFVEAQALANQTASRRHARRRTRARTRRTACNGRDRGCSRLCASIRPWARNYPRSAAGSDQSAAVAICLLRVRVRRLRASPHFRKLLHHEAESLPRRCARLQRDRALCRWPCARPPRQQSQFRRNSRRAPRYARTISPPGCDLRHFHESDAHEIETVGGLALTADHLARRVAKQFDVFRRWPMNVRRELSKHGHAAQVGVSARWR